MKRNTKELHKRRIMEIAELKIGDTVKFNPNRGHFIIEDIPGTVEKIDLDHEYVGVKNLIKSFTLFFRENPHNYGDIQTI